VVKNDTKLLAGTDMGKMYIFNWGEFEEHTDTYPGHKETINSMVAIAEEVVVSATGDGTIRATSLFPHKPLGIVGQHDMTCEKVDISHCGTIIASYSHDEYIKFWNISYFEDADVTQLTGGNKNRGKERNLPSSKHRNTSDFFKDLANG